ncbi:MAG: flagellar hook-associated protein FlgK [Planctomycetota bacterium]
MSLFSSIQMAGNTLRANEIALQVTGQNIANANTPGYIREEIILAPAPTQRYGGLLLGMGVKVNAVVQKLDAFLEERLRGAVSDLYGTTAREEAYAQLEGLVGELSDTDLSSVMNDFFSSISEILNQPESRSVRNLATLQGKTLTESINRLANRATELRADVDGRIQDMAGDINRLIEEIRVLNIRIADTEGGDVSMSDAVGLRDQRLTALENLAELIDIRVVEQPSGGVTVYTGGDFLVFEGTSREVELVLDSDRGLTVAEIHIKQTDAPLIPASGELRGLMDSRDEILGGFLDELDDFARTLAFEFNKLYSSGQGLTGFTSLTSEYIVDDIAAPLNQTGLPFTPSNGSFQVQIFDNKTGLSQTTDIQVDLNGLGDNDTTLESLRAKLDAINGLKAEISPTRHLVLTAESAEQQFAFADDTSGALAALGLNTFFVGSGARDLQVNQVVREDPSKFSASAGGIANDTDIATALAAFLDQPLTSQNGASISVLYDRLVGEMTQGATIATADAEGARVFEKSLRGQRLSLSGVNLDEEAVKMIAYQRSYQASARYIATLTELFEILVNI